MAIKRSGGLGPRDLSFLISSNAKPEKMTETSKVSSVAAANLQELTLEKLVPGKYQPRRDMDPKALQELTDSIKEQGVIQPIIVRPLDDVRYEIIAGERRFRASQLAGLTSVPVVIKDISDQAAIAMALIENIQREDLNPMEEAIALQRLSNEFGLTHEQVAQAVGKSRVTVTHLLRLLHLEHEVQTYLERGDIELGHAKVLLALVGAPQIEAARQVIAKGLTVRETEQLLKRWQQPKAEAGVRKSAVDPDVQKLQQNLAEKLGAVVQLDHQAKGSGKLVIKYNSLEELEGILEHIK